MSKKEIRNKFRNDVFKRDNYTCMLCGKKYNEDSANLFLDSHHITDRSEMPQGGYIKENGISLCKESYGDIESCHMKAERFHITNGKEWVENCHPDDLYKLIKSSKELAIIKSKNG